MKDTTKEFKVPDDIEIEISLFRYNDGFVAQKLEMQLPENSFFAKFNYEFSFHSRLCASYISNMSDTEKDMFVLNNLSKAKFKV